ncbi:hypothetical protein NDU88_002606 [Pleurodeles waltl]|uniref:Reverse transcriptase domain-containing protein n=1 Tax=Pleurodeles waltl TaxID=8319 RepID=A0AAV7V076_PLEWA|nr:hypothetical protein NDU88_002606 [Pleurodeles waltl]
MIFQKAGGQRHGEQRIACRRSGSVSASGSDSSASGSYIQVTRFLDPHQDSFQEAYSTEAVILSIVGNMKAEVDRGTTQALVLLDPSAAFDTVNHELLTERVEAAGLPTWRLTGLPPS